MLYGVKYWNGGILHIKVDGCRHMTYAFYTKREAIKAYRKMFDLAHKKIVWIGGSID